ncbi:MAG TPA: TerB family tellurite resistance protein [Thauera sp.]|jgi:hypothetical protein|nr:TerB family tellurite resistance protein [Thauera sp.]HRA80077.1 TerB family tellurite resistance protein [Thauera sp.]
MRHYEANSTPAVARILAAAVLADGGLDKSELDTAMQTELATRLGIGQVEFEHILRDYCNDLLLGANFLDGIHLKLADEVFALLLEDIRDPALQASLLQAMQDVVGADGVETATEVDLLGHALQKWGLTHLPVDARVRGLN